MTGGGSGRGGGGDQSVIVRLSYEQLNTGHKAGVSLSIGDKHPASTSQNSPASNANIREMILSSGSNTIFTRL